MIGGADENEPEARPPPPWPPIAPPSSPLPGTGGLGRRLLGSIRGALALPASPPAAPKPKVGLGLLLHLRPDHPLLHPPTPPASASEDPLEQDAAAARPHAHAGPRSPVNRDGIVADAAATSPGPTNATLGQWAANRAPRLLQYLSPAADAAGDQEPGLVDGQRADEFRAGDESRSSHVASPPEDESIATDVPSACEEDGPLEDAADAGLDSLVNPCRPCDAAAESALANTPFRKWASKRAPHLLMPAADTAGHQESGLVDGQQAKEFRAGVPTCVASPSDDEEDESSATDVSSVSEQDDPLEDAAEWPHAAQGDAGAELALEDRDATAGDDQVEKVLQQCTGDQLRAARGDQEVVQQGAIHSRDETTCDIAAEDQEKVGSSENVDAVEGLELVQQDAIDRNGEGTDGTAAEDQNKAVEQVDAYGLGTTENGDAEDDREAVEQCVIDKEGAAVDDYAVKDHEVVGPAVMDGMCATIDDISAEDQQKKVEQCSTCDSETIENDDAMEDQEVVEQGVVYREGLTIDHDDYVEDHKVVEQSIIEGIPTSTYGIAVEDQEKVVEQCAVHEPIATKDECNVEEKEKVEDQEKKVEQCVPYDSETIENGDAVEDQEVVQQGVVYREGLTIGHDDYVEDHKVVELQSIIEGIAPSTYGISVEDQEKVVEQRAVHEPETTKDEYNVEEKEKVEDHEKEVEQCVTYDSETIENDDAVEDQEVVEQGVVYREGLTLTIGHYDYVEDHKVVEQSIIEGMPASTDVIAAEDQKKVVEQCVLHEPRATKDEYTVEEKEKVEDQEKNVEQCVIYDLETIKNVDAVEDQEVAEQGVVYREVLTFGHDEYVEDHKVVEQSTIEGMPVSTDDIAVEDQKKVLEQCALHEPRATKDEYTVEEKEKVEQGAIDKQVATNRDVAVKDQDKLMKQHIIDNQGTVPIDDSAVKDCDKAAAQNASDAIITYRDDDPVEVLNKVGNQGVINENGRTKFDTNMEEHGYLKEQVIVDNWGTFSDATVLEDKKAEGELCNGDEQIADSVYMKGSMLEQRTGSKLEATKSDFTVENHKDVVERVCHEWGAPDDDLAMDTAASQSIKEISSSELVSAAANGSDEGIGKEKIKPIRYPQRPGKLNCPFYMSKGSCSYGFSCQFHHPPLKAKLDGSWSPSEQGNHGVAGILELNRIGLPIREGARNCTYYMRNGACRYGKHCHFNHPEHVIDAQFYAPTGWEDNALQLEKSSDDTTLDGTSHLKKSSDDATLDDTSYSKKSSDHATLDDTAYSKKSSDHATLDDTSSSSAVLPPNILRMLLPPQKVLPSAEGKVKKDSEWSSTSDDKQEPVHSSDGPLCKQEPVHSSDGPLCKQEQHVNYPERPGRPECPFYLRFGDCKFASACKYHHSKDKYPELPGEPECPFYMKNRFCKFGAQCRFNHPKDWSPTVESPANAKKSVAIHERHESTRIAVEDHVPQQQQYPERPGQPDCRYYLQFGKCKFMSACIFHHPRDGLPVGSNPSGPAHSDQIGPETHDMPECPFYMKSGKCQFGSACEFHHPKDICSTTEGEFGHKTDLALDNFTRPENAVQTQEQIMYPERPGEPRCFNYMRHGFCRFQMNCKYHHPADRLSRKQYDSTYH